MVGEAGPAMEESFSLDEDDSSLLVFVRHINPNCHQQGVLCAPSGWQFELDFGESLEAVLPPNEPTPNSVKCRSHIYYRTKYRTTHLLLVLTFVVPSTQ